MAAAAVAMHMVQVMKGVAQWVLMVMVTAGGRGHGIDGECSCIGDSSKHWSRQKTKPRSSQTSAGIQWLSEPSGTDLVEAIESQA